MQKGETIAFIISPVNVREWAKHIGSISPIYVRTVDFFFLFLY